MYKDHFRKWGLVKNISGQEATTILRLKTQREATGKNSEFYRCGRKIDFGRVQKHLKRKKAILASTGLANDNMPANVLHEPDRKITAFTPPPSPILHGPDTVEILDEVLRRVRDYLSANFSNGTWAVSNSGQVINVRHPDGLNTMNAALAHFRNGVGNFLVGNQHGTRLLSLAGTKLEEAIIYAKPSDIFIMMKDTLLGISANVQARHTESQGAEARIARQLWQIFWECAARSATTLLEHGHPLPCILKLMGQGIIFNEQRGQSEAIFRFATDQLERHVGLEIDTAILFDCQKVAERCVFPREDATRIAESAIQQGLSRLGPWRARGGFATPYEARIQLSLATTYFNQQKTDESKAQIVLLTDYPHHWGIRFSSLWLLATIEEHNGNVRSSVAALEEAAALATSYDGISSGLAVFCLAEKMRIIEKLGDREARSATSEDIQQRIKLSGYGKDAATPQ